MDDLVTATQIAERLGVSDRSVVHNWERRHDTFPTPVIEEERVKLWLFPDVKRWCDENGYPKAAKR